MQLQTYNNLIKPYNANFIAQLATTYANKLYF